MTVTSRPRGRLLGVDCGDVRIGLAVCDADRIIASPLETYTRRGPEHDEAYLVSLARVEGAVGWVVGLPILLNGDEGPQAKAYRAYGQWLGQVTGLPVVFWDERFTSSVAEDTLREARVSHNKRKSRRDQLAAQIILQSYLEAGCPTD